MNDCHSLLRSILKGLLWDGKEDRSQYEAPQQGNLTYKLFSLDDVLLLVRSTIQKVQPWPRSKKVKDKKVSLSAHQDFSCINCLGLVFQPVCATPLISNWSVTWPPQRPLAIVSAPSG